MEEHVSGVLRLIPDAVIISDKQQNIVFANESAATIFEYSLEELLTLRIADLVPDSLRDKHETDVTKYYESPRPRSVGSGLNLIGKTKTGESIPLDIALGPFTVGDSKLTLAVVLKKTPSKTHWAVAVLSDLLERIEQAKRGINPE